MGEADRDIDRIAQVVNAAATTISDGFGITMNEAIEAAHIFAVELAKVWPMVNTKQAAELHDGLLSTFGYVDPDMVRGAVGKEDEIHWRKSD